MLFSYPNLQPHVSLVSRVKTFPRGVRPCASQLNLETLHAVLLAFETTVIAVDYG
jgi:hypothetical protein